MSDTKEELSVSLSQDKLDQVFQMLIDAINKVSEVGSEQLPLLAQEIVARGLVSHLTTGFVLLLVAGLLAAGVVWLLRQSDELWVEWDPLFHFALGFGIVLFLVASCVAFFEIKQSVLIAVAPKIYVLEQIANLVR